MSDIVVLIRDANTRTVVLAPYAVPVFGEHRLDPAAFRIKETVAL